MKNAYLFWLRYCNLFIAWKIVDRRSSKSIGVFLIIIFKLQKVYCIISVTPILTYKEP